MKQPLFQIGYASRRAAKVSNDEVVDGIALPSYRKNRTLEITGCLWFNARHFVQFIEGPQHELQELYRTICQDSRHHDVRELFSRHITERAFARFALHTVKGDGQDPVHALLDSIYHPEHTDLSPEEAIRAILPAADTAMAHLMQT